MLTLRTASALSDSDLVLAIRETLTHLDPDMQINRDYVLDILGPPAKRPSLRGHTIATEILEFLA